MTTRSGYLRTIIGRREFAFALVIMTVMLLGVSNVTAQSLQQVQQEGEKKLVEAEQSQKRIDKIVEGAQERLIQYRALLKQVEGLKAYNEQLGTQVASQDDLITRFDNSITQVSLIERQMAPLVDKMATSLEQFIDIDLPFSTAERQERMAFIRESLGAADVGCCREISPSHRGLPNRERVRAENR